jgi:predicted phosphodiesterase
MAFTWGNPLNLIRSYRHVLAFIWDTTDKKRAKWVAMQKERFPENTDFRLEIPTMDHGFSFIVLGDPGEGDSSQTVIADKFLREAPDSAFTIIASDVIYPSGRSHDYREKFYVPYRKYSGKDIYAIPGNHDWYDELIGFMIHFCDNTYSFRNKNQRTVDPEKLKALRDIRQNKQFQPNMYFYIETPQVRIVCIDTGIKGRIDQEQERWLQKVSEGAKPKILITGKPIYVNGEYDKSLSKVDAIVNENNYRLVIGGDTHNFQKYRIPVNDEGKFIWHLVNGGAGAFLERTHKIPHARDMQLPVPLREEPLDFECYPTREVSREFYGSWWKEHAPDWTVDRDQPPYHKSFVKVNATVKGLEIQVFVAEDFTAESLASSPYSEWTIPW